MTVVCALCVGVGITIGMPTAVRHTHSFSPPTFDPLSGDLIMIGDQDFDFSASTNVYVAAAAAAAEHYRDKDD